MLVVSFVNYVIGNLLSVKNDTQMACAVKLKIAHLHIHANSLDSLHTVCSQQEKP